MSKIETLEIKKAKSNLLRFAETDIEVDYDSTGFIYEVRVWNDFLDNFIPVQMNVLRKEFTSRWEKIEEQVRDMIQTTPFPQYNNDDPNPAA